MTDSKRILIAYPAGFLCYEKFKRKVDYYTSNSDRFEILCFDDANGFVEKYANNIRCGWTILSSGLECVERSTHAILFEDRGCYAELRSIISSAKTPCRVVPLELTLVVNKDRGEPYDVYVGRGTIWGNPYQIGVDGDREEVIRKFAYDFQRGFLKVSDSFDENISKLKGKVIACHCKPAACHGDIIADYINALDDGQ
ncbi:MAG: DUF4326 domain-containing protein [Pseudomonas sp.]|jgi:hypothetical protein|uniref:DUF4326 domain-containing protein n=1 Tax=Stutzerimonas frequens TaxID=2968969 RepID=UPI000C699730|nr:DUF4326 domain-containing protein [Stutzerimonas frequens]MAL92971.1 hypothetical protein [Pseudomonas sp.]MEC7472088.1 DUF4326 domain-containing protein [Pseudomonadota bacterium]MBA4727058.1 DUF4326 domain-containing protein [Pseudomonas sp.]MBK3916368.1 DUF4326 domain-containing protein [Stutzerimonas frequens]QFU13143.1 hypothetical protein FIU84_14230 [Stutzerimonas frequens]|tara:strand:+ start:5494 stop:6087 length:594 start_codon:yes stop_codon:yes gene_type:complete